MERGTDIRTKIDNARLMTKLSVIGAILTFVLLLLPTLLCGIVYDGFIRSDLFALGVIPYTLGVIFAIASMIYGMLNTSAAVESEEKQLLEKRNDTRALNVEEDVRFTSGRSFDNFVKYAPYVLAILAALIIAGLLIGFFRSWDARLVTPSEGNPLNGTILSGLLAFLSLFTGAFFVGQSRQPAFRWLRAFGAWLLAGFGLMLLSLLLSVFSPAGGTLDATTAKVLAVIFAILGGEFVFSFVIEFYRPRTIREVRPIFESRLLALFTEPGGVMRNIALALDYQFGFKVSGTWLYSFMERSFFPIILFWAAIFWGFTMIYEVGPNQVGVKERLGRVVKRELLQPGIYWTLPYPFGEVKRFSCTQLNQIVIGEHHDDAASEEEDAPDDGHGHAKAPKKSKEKPLPVVLWTIPHGGAANNFIVAVDPNSRQTASDTENEQPAPANSETDAASIAFIRLMIPVEYRIRPDGVFDFAYGNANPITTLTLIGQQAATEYMASTSFMDIMSSNRANAQAALRERIQTLADEHRLGIEITKVMILDSHPPVDKVAPAFQDVIGAMEERESTILRAENYAERTTPEAQAQALQIRSAAQAYSHTTTTVAKAEAARFGTQLETYKIMPRMFRLKAYLNFLERDCRDIRKFIVAAGLSNEVYELNFQSKERLDLIDTNTDLFSGN